MESSGRESVGQWWDACHTGSHPQAGFFLTGHQGPEVWDYLEVKNLLVPGLAVLNIGVGLGHCTRNLASLGCQVSVLDISRAALDKVRDCVQAAYLAESVEDLPENAFDLAISFLVSQHMNHRDLDQQLAAVIRSLKPDGIFAMQYAFRLDPAAPSDEDSPQNCKEGGVCRTAARMEELVRLAGGQVVADRVIGLYPDYGSGWSALRIVKAGEAT